MLGHPCIEYSVWDNWQNNISSVPSKGKFRSHKRETRTGRIRFNDFVRRLFDIEGTSEIDSQPLPPKVVAIARAG